MRYASIATQCWGDAMRIQYTHKRATYIYTYCRNISTSKSFACWNERVNTKLYFYEKYVYGVIIWSYFIEIIWNCFVEKKKESSLKVIAF